MPAARNQDVTVRLREAKRMPSISRGTRVALRGSSQWASWPKALATEVGRCDNDMAGSLVRWVIITPSSPRGRPSSTPPRSAGILLAKKKRSNVGHGRRISRSFAQRAGPPSPAWVCWSVPTRSRTRLIAASPLVQQHGNGLPRESEFDYVLQSAQTQGQRKETWLCQGRQERLSSANGSSRSFRRSRTHGRLPFARFNAQPLSCWPLLELSTRRSPNT